MIMTVNELKQFITSSETDQRLEARLQALEVLIRKYTNNNFQDRRYRTTGTASGHSVIVKDSTKFSINDTIMIDEDLCVITAITGNEITVDTNLLPEEDCLVTKIVYPHDVKMGVVNMIQWDIENRNKVGIQSETISRHSVTYFNMDSGNSTMGYPTSFLGFLFPYKKARF